jgi:hypothetical protein
MARPQCDTSLVFITSVGWMDKPTARNLQKTITTTTKLQACKPKCGVELKYFQEGFNRWKLFWIANCRRGTSVTNWNQSLRDGIMSCPPSRLDTFLGGTGLYLACFIVLWNPCNISKHGICSQLTTRRNYCSSFYRQRVSVALQRFQAVTILRWADVVSWRGLF